jgi:hypothetical protein
MKMGAKFPVIQVRPLGRVVALVSALILLLTVLQSANAQPAASNPAAFQKGDVFAAGMKGGKIKHLSPSGTLIETLDNGLTAEIAGMCTDAAGNLYGTLITNNQALSKFDSQGNLVNALFGSPAVKLASESCIVDASGNFYVGTNYGNHHMFKLDSSGNGLDEYAVAVDDRGSDWIDLSADECTMLYTSEGSRILRYNVCTKTQLSDFATGLESPLYALRIRSNGEVMVASEKQVYRLSSSGSVLQTYTRDAYGEKGLFFALNLDPDGTSFWTGTSDTDNVYKIDIANGSKLTTFNVGPNDDFSGLAGLLIYGELIQARPSSPPPAGPTPTGPAPTAPATANGMSIQAPHRLALPNDLVVVPITLNNAVNVANLNFELDYDATVIRPEGDILKGNLLDNALFKPNPNQPGRILAGFAQTDGVTGTGTVMNVPFRVIGKPGDTSPLSLTVTTINDPNGSVLTIDRFPGDIDVTNPDGTLPQRGGSSGPSGPGNNPGGGGAPGTAPGGIQKGDCDGDGQLTELDALCALEMSTGIRAPQLIMDIDGSGDVTSRDAVIILQRAVGK